MNFKNYWYDIVEEGMSRRALRDFSGHVHEIRRLAITKQIDKAAEKYKELNANAHEYLRDYLDSDDIEAEEFKKVLPQILKFIKTKEIGTANIKKEEADPDLLQALRYVNNLFTQRRLNAVVDYLSSIYNDAPDAYADFIKFASSYKGKSGKTFRMKVFPEVVKLFPELGVVQNPS
jgi:hypothetical protein